MAPFSLSPSDEPVSSSPLRTSTKHTIRLMRWKWIVFRTTQRSNNNKKGFLLGKFQVIAYFLVLCLLNTTQPITDQENRQDSRVNSRPPPVMLNGPMGLPSIIWRRWLWDSCSSCSLHNVLISSRLQLCKNKRCNPDYSSVKTNKREQIWKQERGGGGREDTITVSTFKLSM